MTNEEAIAVIKKSPLYNDTTWVYAKELHEAIKTLEQELCGDAISRQAVLEQTYKWSKDEFLRVTNPFHYLRKRILSLPSISAESEG